MTITVTQEMIDESVAAWKLLKRGDRSDKWKCPIMLAMLQAGFSVPMVGRQRVCWAGQDWIDLPPTAQGFVTAFDQRIPVEPISFYLGVPA